MVIGIKESIQSTNALAQPLPPSSSGTIISGTAQSVLVAAAASASATHPVALTNAVTAVVPAPPTTQELLDYFKRRNLNARLR